MPPKRELIDTDHLKFLDNNSLVVMVKELVTGGTAENNFSVDKEGKRLLDIDSVGKSLSFVDANLARMEGYVFSFYKVCDDADNAIKVEPVIPFHQQDETEARFEGIL